MAFKTVTLDAKSSRTHMHLNNSHVKLLRMHVHFSLFLCHGETAARRQKTELTSQLRTAPGSRTKLSGSLRRRRTGERLVRGGEQESSPQLLQRTTQEGPVCVYFPEPRTGCAPRSVTKVTKRQVKTEKKREPSCTQAG